MLQRPMISLLLILACCSPVLAAERLAEKYVFAEIGTETYLLEVADDIRERSQGLSRREYLGRYFGMLFIFGYSGRQSVWMKGMLFPLDIIWLLDDKVVRLDQNVPAPQGPADKPASLDPRITVDKLIELPAGEVRANGIRAGETVRFFRRLEN